MGGVGPGGGDHLLGNIQAENLGRPLLPRPAGEPAEAEAQVHNALAGKLGKQRPHRGPLRRAGEPLDLPRQLAVAGERSDERRVGNACVSTCRSRWSPDNNKKTQKKKSKRDTTK